jgi:hypothetical protein
MVLVKPVTPQEGEAHATAELTRLSAELGMDY